MRLGALAAIVAVLAVSGCIAGLAEEDFASELRAEPSDEAIQPVFSDPIVVDEDRMLIEPAVEVDSQGRVYVSAIPGVSGGAAEGREDTIGSSQVFQSPDGGQSFAHLDPLPTGLYGPSIGGGDVDLGIGPDDEVYMTDLWAGNAGFVASEDRGETWPVGTPAVFKAPGIDRQWMDVDDRTGTIYLSASSLSTGAVHEVAGTNSNTVLTKSTDGGATFQPERSVETVERNCICPTGPVVVNEPLDEVVIPFGIASGGDGLGVSVSQDGGATWESTRLPGLDEQSTVFPVLDHDTEGNLYLVSTLDDRIVLSTSQDGGRTWSLPSTVDPDPGEEQIIPWVVAGDPGQVAINWREASMEGDERRWDFEVATSTDALSDDPSVHVQQLNDEPIDEGGYSLREVNELALGPEGAIHAAWPSIAEDGETIETHYARQIDGPGLLGTDAIDGFSPTP